jgi:glycosyltransferase involved in cell wall biosynthesis
MKIAIVHEWLDRYAGSERVFEQIMNMYPQADLFAVVDFMSPSERAFLKGRPVTTSFIQRMPLARRFFRHYLGLMPLAVEQLDLSGYDVVISSSHAVAKGVITGPNQIHLSYVHSPMRYAWDLQAQYLKQTGLDKGLKGAATRMLLHKLRLWDARSALGVDVFMANSSYIADRIRKVYRRESAVVHPPVAVDQFALQEQKGDTYMVACRFEPYKRVELIVEAFTKMPDRKLLVVGSGRGDKRIRELAANHPNITVSAPVPTPKLIELMQNAKAFVFAAEEDFGITLVEAQACGTPLIAFGSGGARDIVINESHLRPTGILFPSQTVEALTAAIDRFEATQARFSPLACRENAQRFSLPAFQARFRDVVDRAMDDFNRARALPAMNDVADTSDVGIGSALAAQ